LQFLGAKLQVKPTDLPKLYHKFRNQRKQNIQAFVRKLPETFRVLKYFMSSHTKRIKVNYDRVERVFTLTIVNPYKLFTFRRVDYPGYTKNDMHILMLAELMNSYVMHDKKPRFKENINVIERNRVRVGLQLQSINCSSWIKIRTPFRVNRRNVPYLPPDPDIKIVQFLRYWDYVYFSSLMRMNSDGTLCYIVSGLSMDFLIQNVFLECKVGENFVFGLPWRISKVPTLKILVLRFLSSSNRVYGGDRFGPYTVRTTENVYSGDKYKKLMLKFTEPTHVVNSSIKDSQDIRMAMDMYYTTLQAKKHFRTLEFHFSTDKVMKMIMPLNTAGGIYPPGRNVQYQKELYKKIIVTNGPKYAMEFVTKCHVVNCVRDFVQRRCGMPLKENIEQFCLDMGDIPTDVALKLETLNAFTIGGKTPWNGESRNKMFDKCREFFISYTLQYIPSMIVNCARTFFERGTYNKVGMKWHSGGAQCFVEEMKLNNPNYSVFEGDFSGLDTTIKKQFLELYTYMASVYYDLKDEKHSDIYRAMLKWTSDKLAAKMCRIYDDLWVIMIGKMPSGDAQTSNANSWIVTILLLAYIMRCVRESPKGVSIKNGLVNRMIIPAVYGDDHGISVHKSLRGLINEQGFSEYVSKFGMTIKPDSIKESKGLSKVDLNGWLIRPGFMFLHRYFIVHNDDVQHPGTKYLPFRPITDYYVKIGYHKGKNWADLAATAVGLAYDSMGACPRTHKFLHGIYEMCNEMSPSESFDKHVSMCLQTREMSQMKESMLYRNGIDIYDMIPGFPTMENLLSRHTMDRSVHKKASRPVDWIMRAEMFRV